MISAHTVYIAHNNTQIQNTNLQLTVTKQPKITSINDLAKVAAPKGAQVLYNALRVGPRVILRSAFELLRANTITRVLSAVVLLSIDTIALARGRISKKQYVINLVLAIMLLVGGTAGWVLGSHIVSLMLESMIIGLIAGLAGAGAIGALFAFGWEKFIKLVIKDDSDDMLDICNETFAKLAQERRMTLEEIDAAKEKIVITSAVLRRMFIQKNRAKFALNLIQPALSAANTSSATSTNQPQ